MLWFRYPVGQGLETQVLLSIALGVRRHISLIMESLRSLSETYRSLREEMLDCVSHASFRFGNPVNFIDFMVNTPQCVHSHLRDVRVKAFPVSMQLPSERFGSHTYTIPDVIPLARGLKLDRLTVEDAFHDPAINDGFGDAASYHDVDQLLSSNGWKEANSIDRSEKCLLMAIQLHYISPTAEFLKWRPPGTSPPGESVGSYWQREKQPDMWNEKLKQRDGHQSGAFVRIYREKKQGLGTSLKHNCESVYQPDDTNIEVDTRTEPDPPPFDVASSSQNKQGSSDLDLDPEECRFAWSAYDHPDPEEREVCKSLC